MLECFGLSPRPVHGRARRLLFLLLLFLLLLLLLLLLFLLMQLQEHGLETHRQTWTRCYYQSCCRFA